MPTRIEKVSVFLKRLSRPQCPHIALVSRPQCPYLRRTVEAAFQALRRLDFLNRGQSFVNYRSYLGFLFS